MIFAAITATSAPTGATFKKTRRSSLTIALERNHDQMRENRAIEHGNVKGAEKLDQQRRAEQAEVNADKKDIRKDERDLNRDHADRNADVQQRNRDAKGL